MSLVHDIRPVGYFRRYAIERWLATAEDEFAKLWYLVPTPSLTGEEDATDVLLPSPSPSTSILRDLERQLRRERDWEGGSDGVSVFSSSPHDECENKECCRSGPRFESDEGQHVHDVQENGVIGELNDERVKEDLELFINAPDRYDDEENCDPPSLRKQGKNNTATTPVPGKREDTEGQGTGEQERSRGRDQSRSPNRSRSRTRSRCSIPRPEGLLLSSHRHESPSSSSSGREEPRCPVKTTLNKSPAPRIDDEVLEPQPQLARRLTVPSPSRTTFRTSPFADKGGKDDEETVPTVQFSPAPAHHASSGEESGLGKGVEVAGPFLKVPTHVGRPTSGEGWEADPERFPSFIHES